MKILFAYQVAFSGNGGIERFNRCFMKACSDLCVSNQSSFKAISVYDKHPDTKYIPSKRFTTGHNKFLFTIYVLLASISTNTIILGHVNLYPVFFILRFFLPSKHVILVVHGIDVWDLASKSKIRFLQLADQIISVSQFTKEHLVNHYSIDSDKINVLWNTLDPTLPYAEVGQKPSLLQERYGTTNKLVITTLTRMSKYEWYKGYDQVLQCLAKLPIQNFTYLLCGKYSTEEYQRLKALINDLGLNHKVVLTGYLPENEVSLLYQLTDIFIMPSQKEGFGIVFIEALAHGCWVIGGNKDGTPEALGHGLLGYTVDPNSESEIYKALLYCLENPKTEYDKIQLSKTVRTIYGFTNYKNQLQPLLFKPK